MGVSAIEKQNESGVDARLDRRRFLSTAGLIGLGAATAGVALSTAKPAYAAATTAGAAQDTVKEILTAVLIAEDLATTFYYNALIGPVIQDVNLAGAGGSATNITNGNLGNVDYIRAALTQEIQHATLARTLLQYPVAAGDPYQTFYFPAGTFDTLANFTGLLDALENAFIGAYLNAIQEFAAKSSMAVNGTYTDKDGLKFSAGELDYFAKVAASIMGVETEHRVLGRVISNTNPANNLGFQQLDGLNAVYNGPNSAVAALTPFLTPSTGAGYSLATALAGQAAVSLPVTGGPPPAF